MRDKTKFTRAEAVNRRESLAMLKAFRFLEDVVSQVEALRKTLKEQLKAPNYLEPRKLRVSDPEAEWEYEAAEWIVRSNIDKFEVSLRRPGRSTPILHGAFQISLAPPSGRADVNFFPHVVVLLCSADWDEWYCEEFQLDDDYLDNPNDEEYEQWKQSRNEEGRWEAKSAGASVAFVVPLVELANEKDVKRLIMDPMYKEIDKLLEVMAAPK